MSLDQFEQVLKVAVPFIKYSNQDIGMIANRNNPRAHIRKKVLGIFGGEPLLHPQFPELVDLMIQYVPEPNRGLWTSLDWVNGESKRWGKFKPHVVRLLGEQPTGDTVSTKTGYLNWNMHEESQKCEHSPVLSAAQDLIPDEKERWDVISKCWVQTEWSAAYALDYNEEVKFYFCEVASAFDRVFNLGTGLPVEDGVWSHHLWFERDVQGVLRPHGPYAKQIMNTCNRCGSAMKLPGRRDLDNTDDISKSNLVPLTVLGSPMVKKGQFKETPDDTYEKLKDVTHAETPWEYQKDDRAQQISNFKMNYNHANWLKPFENKTAQRENRHDADD